jgi:heterodisulfide reductase subunit A-like polyferredoxin
VYNFYIDMRTPFKDYDEFYQRVLEEGTLFVRGKVAEVTDAARGVVPEILWAEAEEAPIAGSS